MGAAYEMSEEEKREIVAEFLSESDQHLQNLNNGLLKSEELVKAGQELPSDLMNMMFRAAHTVKGTASMLGFTTLSHLTHEMETLMDRVRNKKMNLTIPIIDVLFKAFDTLNTILDKLKTKGSDEFDVEKIVEEIKKIMSDAPAPTTTQEPQKEAASANSKQAAPVQLDAESKKYLLAFIEDADQNVARFNELLVLIEKEKFNKEHLDEIFRISHTLKGSAGIVKCKGIESVAHRMEDKLSVLREKGQTPGADLAQLLYKGIDWIRASLENMKRGNYGDQNLNEFLKEFSEEVMQKPVVLRSDAIEFVEVGFASLNDAQKQIAHELIKANNRIYKIKISIRKTASSKSLKALLVEERLKRHGTIIKNFPKIEAIDDKAKADVEVQYLFATTNEDVNKILLIDEVDVTSIQREEVMESKVQVEPKTIFETVKEKSKPAETPQAAVQQSAVEVTTMRVDSKKLDNLMNLAGELVITRARFAQLVNEFNTEIFQTKTTGLRLQDLGNYLAQIKGSLRKLLSSPSSAEETAKLFKTIEQMEKSYSEVEEGISLKEIGGRVYSLDEATSTLGKLSSDIQSAVMQTRMVAIEGVFTRFKRLVRDISKDLGKEILLEIYGEDTELDKKIIDSLADPLTHMVRNAIDHGIESKADRMKAGKSEIGTVILRASHRGNSICIDIADDGKGLDAEKLCEKAIEKGLLAKEKAAKMTEKDKLNLIFLPGFSTAEKITSVSGRGVGMDVVKKMIESLNGLVEIETEIGRGTTFVLKIPLTLAIIQALLVVIGEEVFAFPLESVSEIIKIKNKDVYSVDGNPTIKLRGHALSLLRLGKVIKIKEEDKKTEEDKRVVVITDGGQTVGVHVDRLIGEDEIVIKSLPDYFSSVKGVSGASILGDGRIALILDVGSIIREA